jgi:FkbH-like protein
VNMEYSDLLAANRELKAALSSPEVKIAVLSNITIDPLKEILEYGLRSRGVNAEVWIGAYDNIVQDSARCGDCRAVVLFWELATILDSLPEGRASLTAARQAALVSHLEAQIKLALDQMAGVPLVVFNRFSALPYAAQVVRDGPIQQLCQALNARLDAMARTNLLRVDLDRIFAQTSLGKALDWRLYCLARSLYTKTFLSSYVDQILPSLLPLFGRAKKAVICDCDNTLWKGIVAEDGADKIQMSPATPHGTLFRQVQSMLLELTRAGVLVGLCSKNNPADVEAVVSQHPDMILRNESLAIKKINWEDKASNLRAIAEELNIGLDSIVFVDDSPFEIEGLRGQLPEVECFQVPADLFQYPAALAGFLRGFGSGPVTREDARRVEMYREEALRRESAAAYASTEEFLRSLEVALTLHPDPAGFVPRIAQLTQKTNQFNLTTRRYSEEEIQRAIDDDRRLVVAAEVEDRFGRYGLTGVAIIELDRPDRTATIDTLLLSCRVLGRQVETALLDALIRRLAEGGICRIRARYIRTARNGQVQEYYDRFGFSLERETPEGREYLLSTADYQPPEIDYVKVNYARTD